MSYLDILLLILLYWLVIILLDRKGVLKRYNITAYGPILMIRTSRGQRLLDRIARPKKFWRFFANIGTPAMLLGMFIMFALVILMDYFLFSQVQTRTIPPPGKFTEPRNVFLIPGVNEFIPIEWGMIGLIVTLIVHEFSHAILCKVEGITVKSMGILFPIGGFAEPDEEQLLGTKKEGEKEEKKVATRSERVRILAAGVMANFVTALVAFTLFFFLLGTIAPVGEVMIVDVAQSSPASTAGIKPQTILSQVDNTSIKSAHDFLVYMRGVKPNSNITLQLIEGGAPKNITILYKGEENETIGGVEVARISNASIASAGLKEGMVITKMDNTTISDSQDYFNYLSTLKPGENVKLTILEGTEERYIDLKTSSMEGRVPGVSILDIIKDSPAEAAGLKKGMIITQMDNTTITFLGDFARFMNSTHPGQVVRVHAKSEINLTPMIFDIKLAEHPDKNIKKGFLGVSYNPAEINLLGIDVRDRIIPLGFSIGEFPANSYLHSLQKIPGMLTSPLGWVIIFGLPLFGVSGEGFPGFSGILVQFYQPIGWAEPLGVGVFWIINSLLWIGWLNFYVGLFNCLPAVPLDGGHVFRDVMRSMLARFIGNGKRVEFLSNAVVYAFALLILASFIFMFLAPYIVHGI